MNKTKIKLKGRQLKDLQDQIAIVQYAFETALQDCFLREAVYDLMIQGQEAAGAIERTLS